MEKEQGRACHHTKIRLHGQLVTLLDAPTEISAKTNPALTEAAVAETQAIFAINWKQGTRAATMMMIEHEGGAVGDWHRCAVRTAKAAAKLARVERRVRPLRQSFLRYLHRNTRLLSRLLARVKERRTLNARCPSWLVCHCSNCSPRAGKLRHVVGRTGPDGLPVTPPQSCIGCYPANGGQLLEYRYDNPPLPRPEAPSSSCDQKNQSESAQGGQGGQGAQGGQGGA